MASALCRERGEAKGEVSEGAGSSGVAQRRARWCWWLHERGRRWEEQTAVMLCSDAPSDERRDSTREIESEGEQDGEASARASHLLEHGTRWCTCEDMREPRGAQLLRPVSHDLFPEFKNPILPQT
jgi:hypothetical protein